MTFDNSEEIDLPASSWTSKNRMDELASESHILTAENVLQRTRSLIDPLTQKTITETARGTCTTCGKPLDDKNAVMCYFQDLVCNDKCVFDYNGRSLCRTHVEFYLGTKSETIVLISIILGLSKNEIKKFGGLSEESIDTAKNFLINRKHIKEKSFGLIGNGKKITEDGKDVLDTLIQVYRADANFKSFLKIVGWDGDVETE